MKLDNIVTSRLTKRFGDIVAVDHIDLDVPEGSIFGLLGPNGAGKSTTVRLLCTLLRPTEGEAVVAGHNVVEAPVEVRRVVGVLPEEGNHTLYQRMTAYENLEYFAKLYGIPEEEIPRRIEELLRFMDLWERRDDPAGELSSGNRQRLALCRALLHRPKVLLLDEPTASLDPVAAKRVRELILSLSKKYGMTFFINSHNLAEVQRICDRIAIIDQGEILLAGETDDLRSRLKVEQVFRVRVTNDVAKAASVARSAEFVREVSTEADTIVVKIADPSSNNSRLMRMLLDAGVNIVEFSEEEVTLEDLYLSVIREVKK
ncbi:MAG: multidrug ABC transporter ATP-binding protein [Candidatus Thorarchaeota archaeon]|nr:MAG: multidrug ABC transporter ATP-binding protein [Candidatus Thorarchaeota archaeon]RLI56619.1 MAG: multidrug ABC transporter ATP-binding protein [Candidatus Thorarchaeota archaeon]